MDKLAYDGKTKLIYDNGTGEIMNPMFPTEDYDCREAFIMSGVKPIEPMTAKPIEKEEDQDKLFHNPNYFIEEKFDGTRGIIQFMKDEDVEGNESGYCRIFSRNISKKTGFYTENTDSLPHLRDLDIPSLGGTILDGEMFINGRPFKDVSSTLNCLWNEAISRQLDIGFITFHAFDILYFKGVCVKNMPLQRRKEYLHLAIEQANCEYIEEVKYYRCGSKFKCDSLQSELLKRGIENTEQYYSMVRDKQNIYRELYDWCKDNVPTPKAYYEMIITTGGEGVILKEMNGKYYHKRGREYQKVKKYFTKDLILMGYVEPTKVYEGKFPKDKWGYWVDVKGKKVPFNDACNSSAKNLKELGFIPVTKHYYYNQIELLRLGVIVSDEEIEKLPKNKKHNIELCNFFYGGKEYKVLEVCTCGGLNDELRSYFTENMDSLVGSVIEVKGYDLYRDTGKMRHPSYVRMRKDKNAERCTLYNHLNS